VLPESATARMGQIHGGTPLAITDRKALLETIRPPRRRFLCADTGDLPEMPPPSDAHRRPLTLQAGETMSPV
jgi:hypothetical protein